MAFNWIEHYTNLNLDDLWIKPKLKDVCKKITNLFKNGITADDFKRICKTVSDGINNSHTNHDWYNKQTDNKVQILKQNLKRSWNNNGKDCDDYIKYLAHNLVQHYENQLLENEEMDHTRRTRLKHQILGHIDQGRIKINTNVGPFHSFKRKFASL